LWQFRQKRLEQPGCPRCLIIGGTTLPTVFEVIGVCASLVSPTNHCVNAIIGERHGFGRIEAPNRSDTLAEPVASADHPSGSVLGITETAERHGLQLGRADRSYRLDLSSTPADQLLATSRD
jgi:hypothetical protein